MGLKFSKHGHAKVENLTLQHHLINYLSESFYLRHLVSKQRRRMLVAGFDLDMSYITDHILAMSFPAERMRAFYRNPLWQVKSVLDTRHRDHYKVYNLCIEESYDPSHFHGRVEAFPFDDNHVPPLQMIKLFCESVHSWLSCNQKNVAVIHCMAGKGRTGLMVCAYLVYSGMTAEDALELYAHRRTTNNEGVSIPSQRRYVGYWASLLSFPKDVAHGPPDVKFSHACSRELRRIRLYDTINIDSVFFVITELQDASSKLYTPSVEVTRSYCRQIKKGYQRSDSHQYYLSFVEDDQKKNMTEEEKSHNVVQMDTEIPVFYEKSCLDYNFNKPLTVTGDVRVIFYQKMIGGRLFYACFNTSFIKNSLLQLTAGELDKVGSRGKSICGPAFCLELLFGPANVKHSFSTWYDNGDSSDEAF